VLEPARHASPWPKIAHELKLAFLDSRSTSDYYASEFLGGVGRYRDFQVQG
jgi:hypothetical protein